MLLIKLAIFLWLFSLCFLSRHPHPPASPLSKERGELGGQELPPLSPLYPLYYYGVICGGGEEGGGIKRADYLLFKQASLLVKEKEHLRVEGLRKILSLKGSSNNGLSTKLKVAFHIELVERPYAP